MKYALFVGFAITLLTAVTSATAGAPANGRLIVSNPMTNVGANSTVHIVSIPAPSTKRTTIYIPAGYRAGGGLGAVGNNVGTAHVYVTQPDGSRATLNGQLSVVPATTAPFTSCTSSNGTPAAVWMLKANQTGGTGTVTFPIYVDSVDSNPKLPATVSYTLQYCAGATGLNISEVDLDLVRMFDNPQARGMYIWRAVYEPASGPVAGTTASVTAIAAVPINAQVTMKAVRVASRRQWAVIRGFVSIVDHPLPGVRVQIFVGHRPRIALNRPRATVKTKADGSYRVVLRLTGNGRWYARAKASTPYQDITPGGGCDGADADNLSTRGCVDATLAPFVVLSNPVLPVH